VTRAHARKFEQRSGRQRPAVHWRNETVLGGSAPMVDRPVREALTLGDESVAQTVDGSPCGLV
jgi:hypothetical protein